MSELETHIKEQRAILTDKKPPELRKLCKEAGISAPAKLSLFNLRNFTAALLAYKHAGREPNVQTKPRKIGARVKLELVASEARPELDWRDHLSKFGWATCPVPVDAGATLDALLSWCETPGLFDREKSDTWKKDNLPYRIRGIIPNYIGYEEFIWKTRLACREIFESIWKTDDLVCSFDGACLLLPGEGEKQSKRNLWLHSDQARTDPNTCIQGLVNLLPSGPDDGGLVVLEGSHLQYEAYLRENPLDGYNPQWFPDHQHPLLKNCPVVKVCAPPGHILLWDSRTIHCNVPPSSNRMRACVYVCMVPESHLGSSDRKKRREALSERRMTGHACAGPSLAVRRRDPFTYGRPFLRMRVSEKELTPEQLFLAGLRE